MTLRGRCDALTSLLPNAAVGADVIRAAAVCAVREEPVKSAIVNVLVLPVAVILIVRMARSPLLELETVTTRLFGPSREVSTLRFSGLWMKAMRWLHCRRWSLRPVVILSDRFDVITMTFCVLWTTLNVWPNVLVLR